MEWHNPGMSITIQNSNMSAAKTGNCKIFKKTKIKAVVSPLTDETSMKVQRCYLDFKSGFPLVQMGILYELTGSGESKMVASKHQMHVSPLPEKISTEVQWLSLCFLYLAFHKDS